jgi:uncharacterized Fe-S cluster-containing protein
MKHQITQEQMQILKDMRKAFKPTNSTLGFCYYFTLQNHDSDLLDTLRDIKNEMYKVARLRKRYYLHNGAYWFIYSIQDGYKKDYLLNTTSNIAEFYFYCKRTNVAISNRDAAELKRFSTARYRFLGYVLKHYVEVK